MSDTPPIVTVFKHGFDGMIVCWYRTLDDAQRFNRGVVCATQAGVYSGAGVSLLDIPEAWLAAAKKAHETLKAGGDVSHLPTHRGRFGDSGGPLDPVEAGS